MTTNALATGNKGVPLEYASAIFVREKSDTLQLEIRSTQGTLDFIRLTGDSIHFQANDSTIRLFRQFMLHGFEIGTKPKENGGGLCILLRPPMNYEGFAIAINGKGEAAIEKCCPILSTIKRKDYKPKRVYPKNDDLQMVSMYLVYDLGLALGKMEIRMEASNPSKLRQREIFLPTRQSGKEAKSNIAKIPFGIQPELPSTPKTRAVPPSTLNLIS